MEFWKADRIGDDFKGSLFLIIEVSTWQIKTEKQLEYACDFLMQKIKLEEFRLKDFMNVNKEYTKLLAKIRIKTPSQLLEKGRTKKDRAKIAKESGVPEEYVLELVKLSNLARVPGHMKKRARLYFESGLDTFDKIAAQDPEEMVQYLKKSIEKSGFKGSPPTPKDATSSIENSKRIPRIIEF